MDQKERATADALAEKRARQMDRAFSVETTEGTMEGHAGDYLCLDNKGNPYPCAKDVFETSYELAVADHQPV